MAHQISAAWFDLEVCPVSEISVVTFDGDETLWRFQAAMRQALEVAAQCFAAEDLSRAGAPVTASWLATVREDVASRPEFSGASMEAIRWAAFEEVSAEVGAEKQFTKRVFGAYMDTRHSAVTLYDDAMACLHLLSSRGLRLGLITNGNSRPDLLGVDKTFEAVVVAADCGFRKPDPAIYHHAAEQFGVSPAQCVHVGDHPVEDVKAATEAGMRAVWITRSSQTSEDTVSAWRTISRLEELPPALLSQGP
ncbi:HAD family hydrolase [Streptomyces zagrosensis]|uniref:Putative hydrolase of the HAD superfamily n=1 Tax=Streptomyces zagrosensis TaxID=1042984 RepID=A0A7W9QHK9_9ACTN|nr:HAD family hydrolase [Streptomyces zagrosensis]MBB5939793.1 putative hydrolase of the HAD superfamily [Streptomyces zagrosensis]